MSLQSILVLHMTIFLIHSSSSSSSSNFKPCCDSICGDIEIPYPFGMNNPKCFFNNWFEIECINNTTPFLKSINVEVTSINKDVVQIKNPVCRWKCSDESHNADTAIDLRGSPFVYSSQRNILVSIGCNNYVALVKSNGSEVGNCVSICGKNEDIDDDIKDGCHGRYCCENSLPDHLNEYNMTFKPYPIRGGGGSEDHDHDDLVERDECVFGVIVEDVWMNNGGFSKSKKVNDVKILDYVPAMLDWEILVDPDHHLPRFFPPNDPNVVCLETNFTASNNKKHSGYKCECKPGFTGNPYVYQGCTSFWSGNVRLPRKILAVLTSLLSILFIMVVGSSYKIIKRKREKKLKKKYFKQNGGFLLQQVVCSREINFDKAKLFSLKDLEKATNYFSVNRVLGNGGQGTVYKGMLVDGQIVAVKKFKVQGSVEEFINEVVILSQINHRNVVKLLGFCLETQVPLLVYEYIPNGNLFEYLHEQKKELKMTWEMRLKIANEVAQALFYLHSAASQPIYHRDIKSTNILLDEKYRAKIADFGMSRMVSIDVTHITTQVRGTFGYLDPEYFQTSKFTEKSDVYSFGVVLVELLTGQKPISFCSMRPEEAKSLTSYFIMCMEENHVFEILDRRIIGGEKEGIMAVARLAQKCLELNGKKRPTMKQVTMELQGIQKLGS